MMQKEKNLKILAAVDNAPQFQLILEVLLAVKSRTPSFSGVILFQGDYLERKKHIAQLKNVGIKFYFSNEIIYKDLWKDLRVVGAYGEYKWYVRLYFKYCLFIDFVAERIHNRMIKKFFRILLEGTGNIIKNFYIGSRNFVRASYFYIMRPFSLSREDYEYVRNRASGVTDFGKILKKHEEVLETFAVDLVLLPKDSVFYTNKFLVSAARRQKISTVLLPYDDASTEQLVDDRAGDHRHLVKIKKGLEDAKAYPKWYIQKDDDLICLIEPHMVKAHEQFSLTPAAPWVYNSSKCDFVVFDSQERANRHVKSGAENNKTLVLGWPYQDAVFMPSDEIKKERIRVEKEFGFDSDKPLFLLALPPDKFPILKKVGDYKTYYELVVRWAGIFINDNRFNCVITLHPSANYSKIRDILGKNVNLVKARTHEMLPLCDVFVVDCSSTSKWALAMGKLVIDYDIYKFNFLYHSKAKGILHVREGWEVEQVLDNYCSGKYSSLCKLIKRKDNAERWGVIDGKATERLNNFFYELKNDDRATPRVL